MSFISFLIIGLAVGFMSRALATGERNLGFMGTAFLASVGSLLGGMLSFINADGDYLSVRPSGLVFSVLGATMVLFLSGIATGKVSTELERDPEERESENGVRL